jgi:acyl transferase domain-containing protein
MTGSAGCGRLAAREGHDCEHGLRAGRRDRRDGLPIPWGEHPRAVLGQPHRGRLLDPQVHPGRADLEGAGEFDNGLFRITPAEARITDPQHRLFLECAWDALERAGYDPQRMSGQRVGCYGGSGMALYAGSHLSSYFTENLARSAGLLDSLAPLQAFIATQNDHLCTRVSHRLGLRGPSISVQTACSTGLVALHLACQSLLSGETDMALAGAAGVHFPLERGYLYQQGGFLSPDGVCRPFDADAAGTVGGSGAGVLVLRRLEDALADGDPICAVVKGSAVNNDGANRVGYMAPSVDGQVDVLRSALRMAGVASADIGYVEAHGTGTSLGDAVEVSALTEVFGSGTGRECGLGSAKSNIGHLDTAAGLPGLMKAVLALEHGLIPATLNFTRPNPQLKLDSSPFYVVAENTPWTQHRADRLAGVSSFGGGGTNAHVVLAAAPERPAVRTDNGPYLLTLSARSAAGLREQAAAYADHLTDAGQDPAAVCTTANLARPLFEHRAAVAATEPDSLVEELRTLAATPVGEAEGAEGTASGSLLRDQTPVFLFSGQGGRLAEASWALYQGNPVFRAGIDRCVALLGDSGRQLLDLLRDDSPDLQTRARWAQLGLFCFQYALTGVWTSAGVRPAAVLGHSLGEFAAACEAGALDLADALTLVEARGRLMDELCPAGEMLAVMESEERVRQALPTGAGAAEIAVVNAERAVVLGGTRETLDAAAAALGPDTVTVRVRTTHAFHTSAVEAMGGAFDQVVAGVELREPRTRFVSSMAADSRPEVSDPVYWTRQLREPVQFADALRSLAGEHRVFLEIGPAAVLSGHGRSLDRGVFVPSLQGRGDAAAALLRTAPRLHVLGAGIDIAQFGGNSTSARVRVPLSDRIRERYWVDPGPQPAPAPARSVPGVGSQETLFLARSALETAPPARALPAALSTPVWTVIGSAANPVATRLAEALRRRTGTCELRAPGAADPGAGTAERGVVYVPDTAPLDKAAVPDCVRTAAALLRGYADGSSAVPRRIVFLTAGAHREVEPPNAGHAALWGLARSARAELPEAAIHCVDLDGTTVDADVLADIVDGAEPEVVHRDGNRLLARLRPIEEEYGPARLDAAGTYLVTGGLGALGGHVLRRLFELGARHLVAVGRTTANGTGQAVIDELRAAGADVLIAQADISDAEQVASLARYLEGSRPTLRGVVHTAGVLADATLSNLDPASLERVLAPKLSGTRNLDRVTEKLDLDFFVCFSSVTATLGAPAQGAYAAANAAMDAVAAGRRARGQQATSIQWGPWAGGGMYTAARERAGGGDTVLVELRPEQAVRVLDHVIAAGSGDVIAVCLPADRREAALGATPAEFAERIRRPRQVGSAAGAVAEEIRTLPRWQRAERMTDYVCATIATLIGQTSAVVDTDLPFIDLGVDSLTGLRLRDQLGRDLAVTLTATYSFAHPTVTDLSAHLLTLVNGG